MVTRIKLRHRLRIDREPPVSLSIAGELMTDKAEGTVVYEDMVRVSGEVAPH